MDFLRQIPIGQFAAPELEEQAGGGSWLRRLDPRLKLAWTLAFLVTPILAGPIWRLALVGLLLLITALSGLSWRLWRRSVPLLLALALPVGAAAARAQAPASAPISDPGAFRPLTVGSDLTFPPFAYRQPDGKIAGFSVDVAWEIAKRLGRPGVDVIETPVAGLFPGLNAKRYEFIAAPIAVTRPAVCRVSPRSATRNDGNQKLIPTTGPIRMICSALVSQMMG